MRTDYAFRTPVPNMCSRRVSTFSNTRARHSPGAFSHTRSTGRRPAKQIPAHEGTAFVRGDDEKEDIMSAAAAWDVAPLEGARSQPVLRLVPSGPDVATSVPALRISRFGRLLATTSVVIVVTVLAVTLLGIAAAGASIDHTITVRVGQTLSEVASVELPQLSVAEGVAQIQLANDLSTSQVHAGQEIAIPAVG